MGESRSRPPTRGSQAHRIVSRLRRVWGSARIEALRVAVLGRDCRSLKGTTFTVGLGYGAWQVPQRDDWQGARILSAGLGEDSTFEQQLLELGCEIVSVDPTDVALAHWRKTTAMNDRWPSRWHFIHEALWSSCDGISLGRNMVSSDGSLTVLHSSISDSRSFPSTTVEAILSTLGWDAIDLLKLDIEGAELEVLRSLLKTVPQSLPAVILVELDAVSITPIRWLPTLVRSAVQSRRILTELSACGYRCIGVDGWNVTLVRDREAL